MPDLNIKGSVLDDEDSLETYSKDLSGYKVKPKMVITPEDEEDILKIIEYSKTNSIPVTARGSGSNQSGSAVGSGIIILFHQMNHMITNRGAIVKVQPGIVYGTLDTEMRKSGLRIPYDPTSRGFCTIGGNVGTKASGLRSVKYGTTDDSLRSVKFLDTKHGLVDTSEVLPSDLRDAILKLRDRLRNDVQVKKILKNRGNLKSSSGYNIQALYKYNDPEEIVTHLLCGSVGTLGVLTEVELSLVPVPRGTILYLFYFGSLKDAAASVQGILDFHPSAMEIMDNYGLDILRTEHEISIPSSEMAVLMVEFDENLDRIQPTISEYAKKKSISFDIETDRHTQEELWTVRESMLQRIKHELEKPDEKFPAFADDLGVPTEHLPDFVVNLQRIFAKEKMKAVIFGHAGEGNLHVRPMIRTDHWEETIRRLADMLFRTTLRYGGTISGEHGSGRNRSMYLRNEWGDIVYRYFEEIKSLFDPYELLNPDVMFTTSDPTKNLVLSG
jgi:FAD/FMN-containing dehydrogenase